MRRIAPLALAPLFVFTACGDDGGGTDLGVPLPLTTTKANDKVGGAWTELGEADWSCLNTPTADAPSIQAIALTGLVEDFQTGEPIGAVTITAFPGIETTGSSGTATSSDVAQTRGAFTMTLPRLPAGETRFGFKMEAATYLKTYLLNQYLDPAAATQTRTIAAISEGTANALPAFIGVTRDPADGVLAGAFRDCAGNEVSNAIAIASSTSGVTTPLIGPSTYYFSAAPTQSLPVRSSQAAVMNKDGLFVILGMAPQTTPAYIQIVGFTTPAELAMGKAGLKLLAELPSPVEANAVITGSFEPLRN